MRPIHLLAAASTFVLLHCDPAPSRQTPASSAQTAASNEASVTVATSASSRTSASSQTSAASSAVPKLPTTASPSVSAAPSATGKPATGGGAAERTCSAGCFSIERCEAGHCVPNCPDGEVYVPATGAAGFTMGTGMRKRIDPPHNVVLTKPFCMDANEVTVARYKQCVDAKVCAKPRPWGMWINYPKLPDHPINKVHWQHGKVFCEWRKQSLPSEAQWEWAAAGGEDVKWPWGNEPASCKRADYTPGFQESASGDDGCHGGGTSPVGSHPQGDKSWPDGKIHDLAGNVWEWCLDNYKPYQPANETDPLHLRAATGVHVVRGGGWNRSARGILIHYRGGAIYDYQVPGLGFRCVRNPD